MVGCVRCGECMLVKIEVWEQPGAQQASCQGLRCLIACVHGHESRATLYYYTKCQDMPSAKVVAQGVLEALWHRNSTLLPCRALLQQLSMHLQIIVHKLS